MSKTDSWMKPPLLFPCANGVHMPQVGSDHTEFKPNKLRASLPQPLTQRLPTSTSNPDRGYIKKISADLSFSEDVVRERCYHTLPYDQKYLQEALDASDIVPTPPKSKLLVGRHNARGTDRRHMPCHIEKTVAHKLKPIKRRILVKSVQMRQQALEEQRKMKEMKEKQALESAQHAEMDSFFMTEVKGLNKTTPQQEWDAYLMSILSQTTAEWIVKQKTQPGQQKSKLLEDLETRYGASDDRSELIRDDASVGSVSEEDVRKRRGKWKKGDETLLDKVREMAENQGKPTDPYADNTAAAFYRLPAGFRKARREHAREVAAAINSTAHNIEVEPYEAPPPATLRDFINPAAGSTVHQTDNAFEQEWLIGGQQVHNKPGKNRDDDPTKITMAGNNKYQKILQSETPRRPEEWFPPSQDEQGKGGKAATAGLKKYERGLQRWKALPQPVDSERGTVLPPGGDESLTNQDMSQNMVPAGLEMLNTQKSDVAGRKQCRANNSLIEIVEDWRSKWHLDMRYADATPDDLIRDMADLHPHIRLKAITTCARAAEYNPPTELGIQLESVNVNEKGAKFLPEKLFVALECCLEDDNEHVRRAAAIALYTLERPVSQAESILRASLNDEKCVDRWTAAQCLAYYGECDSEVVGELVWQLLNTEDTLRNQQAGSLLARLSENSTLVHSMIAEQLNSSSWRHRVMACKVLPRLHGRINRDLVNKLSDLMWHDFHSEVRKAATQTLGKTGHGKDVHDELRVKILDGLERERQEAVSKVGHLGIMTAKLLPAFLECFDDSYVSVRMEVCIACTNLRIREEQVLEKLVHLATFDPIWKVKALALQALGKIGVVTPDIRECVLWAFRYEDQQGVRVEACHTLVVMEMRDDEVVQILQDRYLVETSDIVKREIIVALELFGISPTADMDMVSQVKNEVRKLCTRNNICAQITLNEAEDDKQDNIQRMIYRSAQEKKADQELAQQRKLESPSSRASAAHRGPAMTVTSARSRASSGRPYSRETTLTSNIDPEIQAILAREDSYVSDGAAESRPDTVGSKRSTKAESVHTEEDEEEVEELDVTYSRPLGQMSQILETVETEEESSSSEPSSPAVTQRPLDLGEGGQTYVEVGLEGQPSTVTSSDVVKVQHVMPQTSTLTEGAEEEKSGLSKEPGTPASQATSLGEDGTISLEPEDGSKTPVSQEREGSQTPMSQVAPMSQEQESQPGSQTPMSQVAPMSQEQEGSQTPMSQVAPMSQEQESQPGSQTPMSQVAPMSQEQESQPGSQTPMSQEQEPQPGSQTPMSQVAPMSQEQEGSQTPLSEEPKVSQTPKAQTLPPPPELPSIRKDAETDRNSSANNNSDTDAISKEPTTVVNDDEPTASSDIQETLNVPAEALETPHVPNETDSEIIENSECPDEPDGRSTDN